MDIRKEMSMLVHPKGQQWKNDSTNIPSGDWSFTAILAISLHQLEASRSTRKWFVALEALDGEWSPVCRNKTVFYFSPTTSELPWNTDSWGNQRCAIKSNRTSPTTGENANATTFISVIRLENTNEIKRTSVAIFFCHSDQEANGHEINKKRRRCMVVTTNRSMPVHKK